MEKLRRWEETVKWAQRNGCFHLTEAIPEDQFYCVENPTSYTVGPMGGPMYRGWDFQARRKPDSQVLQSLLQIIRSRWAEIAGPEISGVTQPLRFDGSKARRLVVLADVSTTPPWGSWDALSQTDNERRSFTRLRAAVNSAITPHEVDHIDFEFERSRSET